MKRAEPHWRLLYSWIHQARYSSNIVLVWHRSLICTTSQRGGKAGSSMGGRGISYHCHIITTQTKRQMSTECFIVRIPNYKVYLQYSHYVFSWSHHPAKLTIPTCQKHISMYVITIFLPFKYSLGVNVNHYEKILQANWIWNLSHHV